MSNVTGAYKIKMWLWYGKRSGWQYSIEFESVISTFDWGLGFVLPFLWFNLCKYGIIILAYVSVMLVSRKFFVLLWFFHTKIFFYYNRGSGKEWIQWKIVWLELWKMTLEIMLLTSFTVIFSWFLRKSNGVNWSLLPTPFIGIGIDWLGVSNGTHWGSKGCLRCSKMSFTLGSVFLGLQGVLAALLY